MAWLKTSDRSHFKTMSQQTNKVIKRQRRLAYKKRRKERARHAKTERTAKTEKAAKA